MRRRQLLRGGLGLAGGTLFLAGGCDLIEFAQNPSVRFKLPPRTYVLRTDDPNWKTPPAIFTQRISCTSKEMCCPPPGTPPGITIPECAQVSIVCETGACGIEFPLEVHNTIDLAKEAPAVANAGKMIKELTLESLEYKINNKVGVDFPAVKLFVAPMTTTTATGAGVASIGETPRAPAGMVTTATREIPAEAQMAFSNYAKDLMTPFNIIASTKVSALSGSMLANGSVEIEVTGTVFAKF